MEIIKKKEAEVYQGDGYSGLDYPSTDMDINFAVINIDGRSPKTGFQTNMACKELLYIIKGSGTLYLKEGDSFSFEQGDVILLHPNERYAFDGHFEAGVPCTPAWTSEQHKYID